MKTSRPFLPSTILLALVVALASLTSACGGGGAEATGGEAAGAVRIDGSSTVFPITEAVAEEFMRENSNIRVSVGTSGTGGGFAKFLRGETDITDASRPIKQVELEQAQSAGISFIELPIAYDGIALVTNPENTWAECLTVAELKAIWEPNSQINNWNQVRPSFPDETLHLYGAGTDSGTYDDFTSAIIGQSGASRTDFTASEDDNVLVQGIQGDRASLGFFGMAYYESNKERLKLIGVDDGNPNNGAGCIKPTTEEITNATYQPLTRPLFIYVSRKSADNPAVQDFVTYYLDHAATLIREIGYVPLPEATYHLVRERFKARTEGSLFLGATPEVKVEDRLTAAPAQ